MPYPFYQQPYQNYVPYQQYQPAQQLPQVQQPYIPVMNQGGIIWISGLQEAQMYPVAPNSAVSLWEKNGKSIYLKQADATGRPSIKIYDLVERAETASDGGEARDGKVPAYATKEELGVVVGAVKDYSEALSKINADIETMKGDLYGVAGKRRAKKTVEVSDDDE